MFDRILTVINKCTKEGLDKKTVDEAVTIYSERGPQASEAFLLNEKKFPFDKAVKLVKSIEKENFKLDVQSMLINGVFSFLFVGLFLVSIIAEKYAGLVVSTPVSLYCLPHLESAIAEYWDRKTHPYTPGKNPSAAG